MKKIRSNKKLIMLIGLAVLIVITLGVTYAFFSYIKEGTSENSIKVGAITFIYTEESNGISIEDALPMSDTDGKAQSKYFDFKIKSNTTMAEIPYSITVRKSEQSTLSESLVKLYLTEVSGGSEQELVLSKYSELSDASWINDYNDKVLYEDTVPVSGSEYVKNYRLRMWLSDDANYNTDNISNKTFSLTVNVYTNQGRSLTKDNITTKDDTRVKMITLNNQYLLESSNETGVDYEVNVPNEVDTGTFTVTENNMLANSTITEIGNSLSYSGKGLIKRLKSNSNAFNLSTTSNYYKLRVRSADQEKTEDYVLKVTREKSKDNNLTSLAVDGYAFQEPFDKDTTVYNVSLEETSINITGIKSSDIASISGTGTKTLSWGENRFDVTVTPEDPNTQAKVYTIIVNNVRPTAPTIQGGTGSTTVRDYQTISVLSPGTAISDVDHYEYYIGTSSTKPADDVTVTGTTQNEVAINNDGNQYIFYRTVSTKGNKSTWSDAEQVKLDYCQYDLNKEWDIEYNGTDGTDGSVQTFTVPCNGTYKLEVYGAEGGTTVGRASGGKGGYAEGTASLSKNIPLYVAVGGKGLDYTSGSNLAGGYNGGGPATDKGSSGGGATTISYGDGTIGNELQADQILLLAGGGGGAGTPTTSYNGYSCTTAPTGGDGGGPSEGMPKGSVASHQTTAGLCVRSNTHNTSRTDGVGGNGGSLICSTTYASSCSAGGFGGKGLNKLNGTMSSGVRSGHGTAKITLLEYAD